MRYWNISLLDAVSGRSINSTGGACYAAVGGAQNKATLYNKDGSAKTNPLVPTNGKIEFYTADAVNLLDLYIQTAKGFCVVAKDMVSSGVNEISIIPSARQTLVIPFSIADTAAATETDTGFDLPTDCLVQPSGTLVEVITLEASKTIDVGILASESGGDANGIVAATSVAAAGAILPIVTVTSGVYSANTFGALISDYTAGTNADDRGLFNTKQYRCNGTAKSLSYTLSSASAAATGYIKISYELPVASLQRTY